MTGSAHLLDSALELVLESLLAADGTGERFARVIRETYDQLYDGGRTGRYRWDQLFKTEKTHFGTLVEINLQREFGFDDGLKLDYRIAGQEVDAKYSQDLWKWMLPPEAVGGLCLVMTADDRTSKFSAGIVRADPIRLSLGSNRDAKRTLSLSGRSDVVWLFRDAPFSPNILLGLEPTEVAAIFSAGSGQRRVNELFRRAVGRRVTRSTVETVAQQRDPMKRVRANGGARQHLAAEGIAIFGGDYRSQRDAAESLGLPVPRDSEFVSSYLRRTTHGGRGSCRLGDDWWTLAAPDASEALPLSIYR
ncbi:MAG: NaeI family type II restriction endonuclease [Nakamurella sp.]